MTLSLALHMGSTLFSFFSAAATCCRREGLFFFGWLVCFCDVRDWSNVFLAGDMGKHDEPKKKESSEDSYSEVEEEAAPKAAPAAPAPAGVARGVPKSAPPAPPRNTRRRAASEASGTSSDRAPRARRNRSRSPADPPVHASPARSPSPEETGKGHGASSQRVRCPVCWASVANTTGGLSQHQYFNQTCNAWRYYQQGYPWTQALRYARQLRAERETEHWDEPVVPTRSGSVAPMRSESVVPARSREQRLRLEDLQATSRSSSSKPAFELMAALSALMAGGKMDKKEGEKKDKKKRRHRHRKGSSPTPEVERKYGRKRPPSDDDMEDGVPQIKRGKDGSFTVRFPPNAVH